MDQDPNAPQDPPVENSKPGIIPSPLLVPAQPPPPPKAEPATSESVGNNIDLDKILLPKKEIHAPSTAQRVNAGALLEQETAASAPAPKTEAKKSETLVTPEEIEQAVKNKKEAPVVQPLQTYKGDIEQLVQNKNVSVVSIAAAEAGRREAQALDSFAAQKPRDWSTFSHILMIAGGVALVFLAVGIGTYVYVSREAGVAIEPPLEAPFISVDKTEFIPLAHEQVARNTLMQDLTDAKKNVKLSLGLIARLYPGVPIEGSAEIPQLMSGKNLLSTLAPNIPEELLRTVDPVHYLIGIHSFDENQVFLILKVDSYEQAYSGMLAWERTMKIELSPLFTRNISPHIGGTAVAPVVSVATTSTTTPSAPPPLTPIGFIDRVVENHDARVIQNQWGDIVLLWTFLDRTTIVITTNDHTLREIVSRRKDINIIPHL